MEDKIFVMKGTVFASLLFTGIISTFPLWAQNEKKDSAAVHKTNRPAAARQRPRTDTALVYFAPKKMDSLLIKGPADKVWRLLGSTQGQANYLVVTRSVPGEVEMHEQWDDIIIARSGHATLRSGYKVKGAKQSGQRPMREWLGGTIENAAEQRVSPGDFLILPAMLAHQYIPDKNEVFTYWAIKVKRKSTGQAAPAMRREAKP